jgi:hypothetical protein
MSTARATLVGGRTVKLQSKIAGRGSTQHGMYKGKEGPFGQAFTLLVDIHTQTKSASKT